MTFIAHHHVMQDDSGVDDICDIILEEERRQTFDQLIMSLEHPESPLHILSYNLLPLDKITPLRLSWETDHLHKNRPTQVYAICQIIPHTILVIVGGEVNQGSNCVAFLVEDKLELQDVEVIF